MKKHYFITGTMTLLLGIGLFGSSSSTLSEPPDPDSSQYAFQCGADETGSGASACCVDFNEAMDAVQRDFQASMQNMIGGERPASEMVDDAYENLRTYNCWLEYICRSVQYSGYAPLQSALGTGLTSEHIGKVPGCQDPEDIQLESQWGGFLEGMKEVPLVGILIPDINGDPLGDGTARDFLTDSKFNFFPRCMTDTRNNASPQLPLADAQYQECKRSLELRFGIREDHTELEALSVTEQSNAFVAVESALKAVNADQKGSALENKLNTIVPKLQNMEAHVGYLTNFLTQLSQRLACYASKCT